MLLESTPDQEREDKAEDRALCVCEEADELCPYKKTWRAGEQASKEFVPCAQGTGPSTRGRQRKPPLHLSTHRPFPVSPQDGTTSQ